MPTRESFFEKPTRVYEILGNRRIITAESPGLVDIVDGMKPGQAVVFQDNIVPDENPASDIPFCGEDMPDYRARRFLKRGPQVDLARYWTLDQAMEAGTAPFKEREARFAEVNPEAKMSGYGWWGIRTRQHRKVHLADCVQGARIFAYSMQNPRDDSRRIKMHEYNSGNTRGALQMMGGDYLFEVPSTSEEDMMHDVLLYAVPVARGMDKFARVRDMGAEQSSKSVTKRISKRYAGRELYFGKQAIAAYIELARVEHEKGNNIPMQMCPFALPTQKTVDFYNKLEKRAMVQEVYVNEEGKERSRKRPLNKAEKEILLWQFVAKHGPKETFFAAGKIQDYNWNRMYSPTRAA